MINLLKADLRRALKDKLFIVLLIILGAFALVTPVLYKFIFALLEFSPEDMQELEMLGLMIDAKSMFFSAFSLSSNFGLILPLFVAIILSKDFSHGTIRNKIICGKSRTSIYFSMFITCSVLVCGFILAYALLTLLVSLMMFDYQATKFTLSDFGYLMASIGLELLIFAFVSAVLTFFLSSMKNAGLSIVMYFVLAFALIIVGSITQTTVIFADPNKFSYKVLEFFNSANAFANTTIGRGTGYELKEILYLVLPTVAFGSLAVIFGLLAFRKKDIK